MAKGKEIQSRAFSMNPRFGYLPAEDRYLFAMELPRYKFNVIGGLALASTAVNTSA